jgi:predicted nucleic acid-binding protein
MKPCVLQDSSFLIPVLDDNDVFHKDALRVSKELSKYKGDINFVIPSVVFFEVFATLIKKGIPRQIVEKSLWKFLHQDNILTVSVIETMAFRFGNRLQSKSLSGLKTSDFVITSVGLDYEAQILTFDKNMRKRVVTAYSDIYYCSNRGKMKDETERFLNDLQRSLSSRGAN